MANFDDILEEIEEMLDDAWNLPMTGGKCVVDGDLLKEKISGLRISYPAEIKRAKAIIDERERILARAKKDADAHIEEANRKAEYILNEQAIMKEAREKSERMIKTSQDESNRMRKAAVEFVNSLLQRTQELYDNNLASVRQAIKAVNSSGVPTAKDNNQN